MMQCHSMPKGLYGYHEAVSIQLVPSSVLGLASTSSTVSLLLLTLASPAVVAKTCMSAIQNHTRCSACQANAHNDNQEPSEAAGIACGGIKDPEHSNSEVRERFAPVWTHLRGTDCRPSGRSRHGRTSSLGQSADNQMIVSHREAPGTKYMHLHAAGNGLALSPRPRQMQTQSTIVGLQAKMYRDEQLQSSIAGLRAVEAHVAECPTGDLLSRIA